MPEQQTKTVEGYFGPKQMTRDEFVKRWTSSFSDCFWLAQTSAEFASLKEMQDHIATLAGNKWDAIK